MRRSLCVRKPVTSDDYVYLDDSDFNISQYKDPNSFDEAVSCFDGDRWFTAIQEVLKFMHDNDVLDLVDLLDDFKPTDCKLVFKTKRDSKVTLST